MSKIRRRGWPLFALFGCVSALAQPGVPSADNASEPAQKTVNVVRTDTAPVIDGVLDDAVWATATVLDDLHQVNPTEYAPASERTEILLLYDKDALYVGVKVYTRPGEITAHILRQNGNLTGDDSIFVTIDPFNTRRAGYFFGVNPNGVRMDGLYRNVSEYYGDWDSIYYVGTSRFDEGWIAEFKIPFKSISFDPTAEAWGLNFSRGLKRRNEDMAWVSRNRRWDPSTSGLMTGLHDLDQGIGLDVVPSASATKSRVAATDSHDTSFEPSLDIAYKITPSLNGLLTINTDFAATEVDDRQVNLTRFGLFFPEKRDFFLREADIFEFGRIGASDGNGSVSGAEKQNARPFFSRRIGLDAAGMPVDLDYGGKVSGRVGRFELGALSIRQDRHGAVDATTLSVVRAKAGIGAESTVGAILTSGDPLSNVGNSLAGVDFLYRNSKLRGGRTVEALGWYQESTTDGLGGDNRAAGVGFSIPSNAKFRGGLTVREVEANFNPALGFLSRRDVRDYSGHVAYTHRPQPGSYWQQLFFDLDGQRIERLGGGLESQVIGVTPIRMTNGTGDYVWVRENVAREVLLLPFEISPGIVIAPGDYSFTDSGLEVGFSTYRPVAAAIAYTEGGFYDGTRQRTFGSFTWAPTPHFRSVVGFNVNDIHLSAGRFRTEILSTTFDVVFSSRLSWTTLIQYDNVSEILGVNLRLNWIPEAGREIFFVINHNLEDLDKDDVFHTASSDIVAKVSYTFRF